MSRWLPIVVAILLFFGTGAYIQTKIRAVYATHPDFNTALAAGWLANSLIDGGTVNKFGFNGDVDTTEESIWDADDLPSGGAGPGRCFANIGTTAADMYVSSDDAADATLGISIEVLDASWDVSTVTMNLGAATGGTGTLFTQIGTATMLRVNRAFATGDDFTGNIYIHTDTSDTGPDGIPDAAGDIVAVITAGENQTLQACYTCPNGMDCLLTQFCIGNLSQAAASQDVTFRLRRSVEGAASRTTEIMTLADSVTACVRHNPPIVFDEKTDIELTADAAGASQGTSGTFDILLLPEL